jgi:predicted N-acetyltransferase YhbS
MMDLILLDVDKSQSDVLLRSGKPEDAVAVGEIIYRAFTEINSLHGFPPDFPNAEAGIGVASMFFSHPGFFSVVAESDGRIIGSNFLDERSPIAGVGPITVDPNAQNSGVGRRLMQAVLDRVDELGYQGVRLLQGAFHGRSMALYASLGFLAREQIVAMQGPKIDVAIPGKKVRPAVFDDLEACNRLCIEVHGHHRGGDLSDAIRMGGAVVVENDGRITGYSTGTNFFGHSVGESNADLAAILGAAQSFDGPGVLIPVRNHGLFQWCLQHGLRIQFPLTLMTKGFFQEPEGVYLPSIYY